jgi:response regulator RpfG family c-di-GMP phosphodiesterase
MAGDGLPRVLLVDDEVNLLQAMVRGLHGAYSVVTSGEARAALELLRNDRGFTVIVSDLRMPGMDGVRFLREARQIAPDSVRMLFTGQGDYEDAVNGVNEGAIFRFITKPCPLPDFKSALDAATRQHGLITAERVLLEQTLQGSVRALAGVLELASPAAFGRGARARKWIEELTSCCDISERWPVEVAAMLSQIACVALPADLIEKLYHGQQVTPAEQAMIDRLPTVTEHLLGNIPRLDPVRRILLYRHKHYDGAGVPQDAVRGESIPWGARALKVIFDFDVLEAQGNSTENAFDILNSRKGWYDPAILSALAKLRGSSAHQARLIEIGLHDVRPGMVFAQDVRSARDLLLIARGQEATPALVERIRNFSPTLGVKEPVQVIVPSAAPVSEKASQTNGDSPE